VSDWPRGPGWWLASDDKWYPPPSNPQWTPPPAPVERPEPWEVGPRLSGVLAAWTQGLMWISGSLWLVAMLAQGVVIQRFNAWWDAPLGRAHAASEAFESALNARAAAGVGAMVVWTAAFILLLVWMNQAHKTTTWLNPQPRSWSSGWTVGGWFIPIANLVIPKLVFHEIERLALAARDPDAASRDWRTLPTMPVGWVWWLGALAAYGAFIVSGVTLDGKVESGVLDAGSVRAGYGWGALANALLAASAIAAGLHVRALTQRITGAATGRSGWSE
jgi:hypothetical protein